MLLHLCLCRVLPPLPASRFCEAPFSHAFLRLDEAVGETAVMLEWPAEVSKRTDSLKGKKVVQLYVELDFFCAHQGLMATFA